MARSAEGAAGRHAGVDEPLPPAGTQPVDEPVGHVLLHRLDDLAYGVGVWRSAVTERSPAALRPELTR